MNSTVSAPSRNTARKASAPTAHTVSCASALIGLVRQIFLPAARILLHHQPAADIEHQGGGEQDDDAFEDVAVVARIEHRKQPGRDEAGADRGERAAIQRPNAMRGAGLGQIARQRGDHQHGFEPLAEQNDGGLDEC